MINHLSILGLVIVWVGLLCWLLYSAATDDPWYYRFAFHKYISIGLILGTCVVIYVILVFFFTTQPLFIDIGAIHKQFFFTREKQWEHLKK